MYLISYLEWTLNFVEPKPCGANPMLARTKHDLSGPQTLQVAEPVSRSRVIQGALFEYEGITIIGPRCSSCVATKSLGFEYMKLRPASERRPNLSGTQALWSQSHAQKLDQDHIREIKVLQSAQKDGQRTLSNPAEQTQRLGQKMDKEFSEMGFWEHQIKLKRETASDTKDLVQVHPLNRKLFKVYGRADDQIMHSTGEKTNPGPIEAGLTTDKRVAAALMFGRSKFQPGVLILPTLEEAFEPNDTTRLAEYRASIWLALVSTSLGHC
ncbi:hypothetical protein ARMSODRAFT_976064 [Armillaria solidipes]|uniref:Uncharacterized protein n=1 Tax=Armillaria solidipes TaxID=1076256 RepID=A0A2H3BML4_9AGAR|nr:hypothetical protein ARMSODRAFT_976064 [Armillaria solidipes]